MKLLLGPLQCYEKDLWNKNVFRWCRKDEGYVMETRLSGNAFQILAAATGKARLPTLIAVGSKNTKLDLGTSDCWSELVGCWHTENTGFEWQIGRLYKVGNLILFNGLDYRLYTYTSVAFAYGYCCKRKMFPAPFYCALLLAVTVVP